jgi:Tfp pilus assembly PilM family ATPase
VALDVGHDATNMIVSSRKLTWSMTLGFGGQSFTRALARDLKLTYTQAEQLKRDPGSASQLSPVYKTLDSLFEDFLEEIRLTLKAFTEVHPSQPIERVLGLGGSFQLHGLLRYLRFGR